jgi:protein-S-isoprenylcysteine O-methyltransferase Ste14
LWSTAAFALAANAFLDFLADGDAMMVPTVLIYLLVGYLYWIRRPSAADTPLFGVVEWVDKRPLPAGFKMPRENRYFAADLVAVLSTLMFFAYEPHGGETVWTLPVMTVWAGGAFWLWAAAFLGPSFGLLPRFRGLRRDGPYRFVRHPMYAAVILMDIGHVLASPTAWNGFMFLVVLCFTALRIIYEEWYLMQFEPYRKYADEVRYCLLPRVW